MTNNIDEYKYIKNIINNDVANYYFKKLLLNINWIPILGLRKIYQYPIIENNLLFNELLEEIVLLGNELLKNINTRRKKIKSIFLNLYENGNDKAPYHKDMYECDVLTLSFGSTRKFRIKNDITKISEGFDLNNGDGFYFTKEFNDKNKHSLMPTKKNVGQRISVVFFIY